MWTSPSLSSAVFTGTTGAPTRAAPNHAHKYSGLLCRISATWQPLVTPSERSPFATRAESSSTSA